MPAPISSTAASTPGTRGRARVAKRVSGNQHAECGPDSDKGGSLERRGDVRAQIRPCGRDRRPEHRPDDQPTRDPELVQEQSAGYGGGKCHYDVHVSPSCGVVDHPASVSGRTTRVGRLDVAVVRVRFCT